MTHVPHKEITPGYWYLRTDYSPFYCIVYVIKVVFGPEEGSLKVFMTDHEGWCDLNDFGDDQFIGMVPSP